MFEGQAKDTVAGWQSTFQGLIGDFGKVAASNLMKQTESLNEQNNIAPYPVARASQNGNLALIIGGAVALVVVVVLLVKR